MRDLFRIFELFFCTLWPTYLNICLCFGCIDIFQPNRPWIQNSPPKGYERIFQEILRRLGRNDIDRGESPLKTNAKPTSDKQLDNSSDDDKMIILHTFWLLMLHLDHRILWSKNWTQILISFDFSLGSSLWLKFWFKTLQKFLQNISRIFFRIRLAIWSFENTRFVLAAKI